MVINLHMILVRGLMQRAKLGASFVVEHFENSVIKTTVVYEKKKKITLVGPQARLVHYSLLENADTT